MRLLNSFSAVFNTAQVTQPCFAPDPPPLSSGLLDYEEGDDGEHQVELAVLAEALHEALMKGYGDAIYTALLANRCVR